MKLARTSGKSLRQIAMDLGIPTETLGVWVREDRDLDVATPLGADERAGLVDLRRRVKILETEREIPKGAAALFASETDRTR